MHEILILLLYSFFAGITVFVGGVGAWLFDARIADGVFKQRVLHTSIACGGGIIIAAVAFVLVPDAMQTLSLVPLWALFLGGGVTFHLIDKAIEKRGGAAAQIFAMLMDFVPEAIALGAVFATQIRKGMLLALFIGLQNLPEAFNAYRDMRSQGISVHKTLGVFFVLSFSGVIGATLGYAFLRQHPDITASLMIFASGGILYLIFQDIAPLSRQEGAWFPALGVNAGFLIGMIGQKLLG